ncbi:uncharacterized protein BT62DRAFT_923019 [Guyanagaster necrorhizus]|uniref:Uncharacterized protein n=1 Tax=Guyanagaster necrorhizus TaxID=856835 RepID=A0A9P7VJS2_9AGAR|nr:uncharacterized protein BT62DRAFT_923019 [Guyanagaster necrorhizus MCA 3950]KAG7441777.1 hypothetical protein BT62DRAFT_923019 [Guyanagaster necrorhizus MCA 3950]
MTFVCNANPPWKILGYDDHVHRNGRRRGRFFRSVGLPTIPVHKADTGTVYMSPYPYRRRFGNRFYDRICTVIVRIGEICMKTPCIGYVTILLQHARIRDTIWSVGCGYVWVLYLKECQSEKKKDEEKVGEDGSGEQSYAGEGTVHGKASETNMSQSVKAYGLRRESAKCMVFAVETLDEMYKGLKSRVRHAIALYDPEEIMVPFKRNWHLDHCKQGGLLSGYLNVDEEFGHYPALFTDPDDITNSTPEMNSPSRKCKVLTAYIETKLDNNTELFESLKVSATPMSEVIAVKREY